MGIYIPTFEQYLNPEHKDVVINEGMSNFPTTKKEAKELAKLMEKPIYSDDIRELFSIIDDDELHDTILDIDNLRNKDGGQPADVRQYVADFVRKTYKNKESLFEPISEVIWRLIINAVREYES